MDHKPTCIPNESGCSGLCVRADSAVFSSPPVRRAKTDRIPILCAAFPVFWTRRPPTFPTDPSVLHRIAHRTLDSGKAGTPGLHFDEENLFHFAARSSRKGDEIDGLADEPRIARIAGKARKQGRHLLRKLPADDRARTAYRVTAFRFQNFGQIPFRLEPSGPPPQTQAQDKPQGEKKRKDQTGHCDQKHLIFHRRPA